MSSARQHLALPALVVDTQVARQRSKVAIPVFLRFQKGYNTIVFVLHDDPTLLPGVGKEMNILQPPVVVLHANSGRSRYPALVLLEPFPVVFHCIASRPVPHRQPDLDGTPPAGSQVCAIRKTGNISNYQQFQLSLPYTVRQAAFNQGTIPSAWPDWAPP